MNKKIAKGLVQVGIYLLVFIVIQIVVMQVVGICSLLAQGFNASEIVTRMTDGSMLSDGKTLCIFFAINAVLASLLFVRRGWAPVSRSYLQSRPWAVLFWVVILSLGTLIPFAFIEELTDVQMPEATLRAFSAMLREPVSYAVLGVLVPLAEELVFRGAILRILLGLFSRSWHWVAIIFSALIFGAIHLNLAQGLHAFVIGLLLGWMYYRTSSVVPGILLHWIHNTVAYLMFHLMPQFGDGKLIDFFHGDESLMYKGLGCSLLIILPSLFQIARRMKRTDR